MKNQAVNLIIFAYTAPILAFSAYSAIGRDSWFLFSLGLLLSVTGSIALILCMQTREIVRIETKVVASPKPPPKEEEEPPIKEDTARLIAEKEQAVLEEKEKSEELEKQIEQLHQEFLFYQEASRGQLKQKETLISEYAKIADDLKYSMDKKQQQISKLESSVQDLTYEIKTLLNVSETPEPKKETVPKPPVEPIRLGVPTEQRVCTSQGASQQLKRCIDISQKLTGASHVSMSSRFRDVSIDSYALDQRRLFDTLGSETSALVVVYSKRESKLIFANNEAKTLFGWSADKFIQDFPTLIQEGHTEWSQAVSRLSVSREVQVPLVIKCRSGNDLFVHCHIGMIPTGIFKNHIIGIAYTP